MSQTNQERRQEDAEARQAQSLLLAYPPKEKVESKVVAMASATIAAPSRHLTQELNA